MAGAKQKYKSEEEQKLMSFLWSPEIKDSPLNFVMAVFPWGQENTPLAEWKGPKKWQIDFLLDVEKHIKTQRGNKGTAIPMEVWRSAVASGRGIGKSALIAWLILWMLSTKIGSTVIVSANGEPQLKSVTWGELAKWHAMASNSHWFDLSATKLEPAAWYGQLIQRDLKKGLKYYYAEGKLWSEENPSAYAGVHSQDGMMVIFDEGCHDELTEVMTDTGWKFWRDVTMNDRLLTMKPDTHEAEYHKPIRLFKYEKNGEMYKFKQKGADFMVTPNHEMYFCTQKSPKFRKQKIEEMNGGYMLRSVRWNGNDVASHEIEEYRSARKTYPAMSIDMDAWIELLGWYLSEGNINKNRGIPCGIGIANKDPEVISRLEHLIRICGFDPKTYPVRHDNWTVRIGSGQLANHLIETCGQGSLSIRIPDYVRHLSKRQIRIFLDAYREGDGYRKQKSEIIYTSSKQMAGDLQELYLKLGMRCSVVKRKLEGQSNWVIDHYATSTADGYVVSASEHTYIKYRKEKIEKVHYEGFVYCAEVPNHLLLTRRNGYAMWSGNSGIPSPIWDVAQGYFTDLILDRYWMAFSNPRHNEGAFFECFGAKRNFWNTRQINALDVEGSDHAHYNTIIAEHGADSFQAKIEVYGEFPSTGEDQFIPPSLMREAMEREVEPDPGAPLLMGVDVARFGDDCSVIAYRQGRDATVIPWYIRKGVDTLQLAEEVARQADKYKPDAIFIDGGGVGGGVIDQLKAMKYKVFEVQAGENANDKNKYLNKRIENWDRAREWLSIGRVPNSKVLYKDAVTPKFKYALKTSQLQLERKDEMKRRGEASPDEFDALALTFAKAIARKDVNHRSKQKIRMAIDIDYNVFG